jgi:hypothetical protein
MVTLLKFSSGLVKNKKKYEIDSNNYDFKTYGLLKSNDYNIEGSEY